MKRQGRMKWQWIDKKQQRGYLISFEHRERLKTWFFRFIHNINPMPCIVTEIKFMYGLGAKHIFWREEMSGEVREEISSNPLKVEEGNPLKIIDSWNSHLYFVAVFIKCGLVYKWYSRFSPVTLVAVPQFSYLLRYLVWTFLLDFAGCRGGKWICPLRNWWMQN